MKYRRNSKVVENTKYGQGIFERRSDRWTIYLNGMKISQERKFIFLYNIINKKSTLKNGLLFNEFIGLSEQTIL